MTRDPLPLRHVPLEDKASYRTILGLAWPQAMMMVAHFLIGFVDVWVAGRIGREVQATLGMITQALFFFLIIGMAVANGGVAAISQSVGMGLYARVRRYVGFILVLGAACGVALLVAGQAGKSVFLGLLQVPDPIRPVAAYFLDVYLLLLPAYYLFVITNAVFRAQKKVSIPLYAMCLVTALNTVGDLGLGLGWFGLPRMGYAGLVWTTFVAVHCGLAFNLLVLRRMGLLCAGCIPPLRWMKRAWYYLFKVAWPAGAMQVLWQTGYLVLYAITASLPVDRVDALAGMTAGIRIESALFLPGMAFNLTASILVGNYLGAGKPEEAKRLALRILGLGVGLISLLAVLVWLFVEPIAAFLAPDPTVQAQAVDYLRFNLACMPFTCASMILGGVMIGAGATLYNMAVFGFSTWCVRLPLAYLLGHVLWAQATGVWAAMFASQTFQGLVMFCLFLFGNWRRFGMRAGNRRPATTSKGATNDSASV